MEDIAPQTFKRRLYGGGTNLPPNPLPPPPPPPYKRLQNSATLRRCIASLVFNTSLSNLAALLILRRSFQPC